MNQVAIRRFPALTVATPRLHIRPLVADDAPAVTDVFADRQTQRWLPVSRNFEAAAWCTELAVERRDSGERAHASRECFLADHAEAVPLDFGDVIRASNHGDVVAGGELRRIQASDCARAQDDDVVEAGVTHRADEERTPDCRWRQ